MCVDDRFVRITSLLDVRCPRCHRLTVLERMDGGSWRHLCGAILKVGNEQGCDPDQHPLYLWNIGSWKL